MKLKNILFSFLLILFFSGNILSHQKSQSYTSWKGEVSGTDFAVTVSTKISKGVLFNQLQNNGYRIDQLENYFKNKINSEDCFSQNPLIQDQGDFVKYLNKFVCSVEQPRFNFDLFFDLNLTHLDFSSQEKAGQLFPDFIISSDNRQIYIFDENQSAELKFVLLKLLVFRFQTHFEWFGSHCFFISNNLFVCKLKNPFFVNFRFYLRTFGKPFFKCSGSNCFFNKFG